MLFRCTFTGRFKKFKMCQEIKKLFSSKFVFGTVLEFLIDLLKYRTISKKLLKVYEKESFLVFTIL